MKSIVIYDNLKKGDKMAYTEAGKRAVAKYMKEKYDRFLVTTAKGQRDIIKTQAESKGMSLNAYINDLIEKDMKENEK